MPKSLRNRLALLGAVASLALAPGAIQAQEEPIKVGVLHSLSGTMAISETTLKDVMLMLIEEQNAKGGLLGRKIEAVVVDPASDWPLFAEKARELIEGEEVDVVFGCWTSVSRKSVLPVFEELNGLLFYPVQYEGEESSRNVFYTGAAPNQQAIPAVEYLMSEDGGGAKRFVLLGTDYVYPRTTNKILRAFLTPRASATRTSWRTTRRSAIPTGRRSSPTSRSSPRRARRPRSSRPSTATPTCRSTRSWPTRASRRPSSRSSRSRSARRSCPASTPPTWSATSPPGTTSCRSTATENDAFIAAWHEFIKNPKRVTNDPMEAHYIGFKMWVQAVEQAGTTDVDAVRQAMYGQKVNEPDRRHRGDELQPPPLQAGPDRRDPAGRPVRGGVGDRRAWSWATPGPTTSPKAPS